MTIDFSKTVPPRVVLAPMAGYTDAAMRLLCFQYGADWTYTEMTNGYGLLREEEKTWHLLETFQEEGPVFAHLYGNDPSVMGTAAHRVEETGRFAGIDLNAGCPVRKVTASGAGAALISNPELFHQILAAMVRSTHLPVTVKTRLGPHPDQVVVFELLDAAERAGVKAMTVHGRFISQRHSGTVHTDLLAEVKRRSHIPIFANGDVDSLPRAWRMVHETECDGLMIARGAIGNPWIFQEISEMWPMDGQVPSVDFPEGEGRCRRNLNTVRDALLKHIEAEKRLILRIRQKYHLPQSAATPEEALVAAFRMHLFRYLTGLQGVGHLRRHLADFATESAFREAIDACFENEAAFRAAHPRFATKDSLFRD